MSPLTLPNRFFSSLTLGLALLAAGVFPFSKALAQTVQPSLSLQLQVLETNDIDWLKKMAQRGYPFAQLSLARAYRLGKGVSIDPAQQAAWTQKAALQNFVWAQYEMGRLFENGEGVPADLSKALSWYRQAGEQELLPALRRLADLKDGADGGEGWRQRLALVEERERRYRAVSTDIRGKKLSPEAAYAALDRLATEGHPTALTDTATRLIDGLGVEKNIPEGINRLLESERRHWPGAPYFLGRVHLAGLGVARDPVQAAAYFKKAVQGHFIFAYTELAKLSESGVGVPQDVDDALGLYRMAAERGDINAQRRLGEMAEAGQGQPKNIEIAVSWYRKAAQGGDAKAKEALARLGKPLAGPEPSPAAGAAPSPATAGALPPSLIIQAIALTLDNNCKTFSPEERKLVEAPLKEEATRQNKSLDALLAKVKSPSGKPACDQNAAKTMRLGLVASVRPRYQEFRSKDAEARLWSELMPARLINRRCGFFGEEKAKELDRFAGQLASRIQSRVKDDPVLAIAIPLVEEEFANTANKASCDAKTRQQVEAALKFVNSAARKGGQEY